MWKTTHSSVCAEIDQIRPQNAGIPTPRGSVLPKWHLQHARTKALEKWHGTPHLKSLCLSHSGHHHSARVRHETSAPAVCRNSASRTKEVEGAQLSIGWDQQSSLGWGDLRNLSCPQKYHSSIRSTERHDILSIILEPYHLHTIFLFTYFTCLQLGRCEYFAVSYFLYPLDFKKCSPDNAMTFRG